MTRKRSDPRDAWMPPRVYRGKSAYEWKTLDGKTIRLCKLSALPHVVIERYNEAVNARPAENSLAWLADEYHKSLNFARLSKVTQADYLQASKKPLAVFGKMQPGSIRPPLIRQYMDKRGVTSIYRANRELSWLMVVFAYGFERGYVPRNPCIGVKKFPEERRQHYVDQDTYNAVLERATDPVKVAMELAYCTGLRQADILSLTWNQVKEDGIHVKQSKTGKALIKAITPRVQAALELAKTLPVPKDVKSWNVVHTRSGRRYTRTGFNSVWHRLNAGFTFHDLRRAGATDFEGERKAFTGHTSERMAESYNVKPMKSPSH